LLNFQKKKKKLLFHETDEGKVHLARHIEPAYFIDSKIYFNLDFFFQKK